MKVAALQMVSAVDRDRNLAAARELLAQAAQAGAELAVLPEYFCLIGRRDTDKLDIREALGQGPIQSMLSQAAREEGMWIVGGTLPLAIEGRDDRVLNTSLVFDPSGQCVARYDKIHLFGFDNGRERYDESRVLQRGQQPVLFELPSRDGHTWRIGLSVCYDVRFPELYRCYADQGVELMLVPSAFTATTGEAHWELLLRARAVENLSWVLAPAQGGTHENMRRTWGHSMLVNPWGQVVGCHPTGPGLVLGDLDIAELQQFRTQLPALGHRCL